MGCGSSASASEPGSGGARSGGGQKGKNLLNQKVEFHYFQGLNGRADPIRQMFEYHGQQYAKIDETPEGWEARKARGEGGEFGGGLPYAEITVNGQKKRLAQFGAILRMFCVKYGYYNPKDYKCSLYHDPIVDTWADVQSAAAKILFGSEADKPKNVENFIGVAKKFHMMIETQMRHHGGKYAGGNSVGMADFVMAAWIGNFVYNPENPFSQPLQQTCDATPKFKAYCQ